MKEYVSFSFDVSKSLLENLQRELKDCDLMIELFKDTTFKVEFYKKKKKYLLKLMKECVK